MRITNTVLAVTAGALLLSGCGNVGQPAVAGTAPTEGAPSAGAATRPAQARTLDGTFYYNGGYNVSGEFYSVRAGTKRTVLKDTPDGKQYDATVSPDGRRVAYLAGGNRVTVAGADGTGRRSFAVRFSAEANGPAWTADGAAVIGRLETPNADTPTTAGTVRVSDGVFTALPRSIQGNFHYRMSGDGKRYFYVTKRCAIHSAKVDGTDVKRVPGFGEDAGRAENPQRLRACDIGSVNHDGSRLVTALAPQRDTGRFDELGDGTPETLVDTASGKALPLRTAGGVRHTVILRDGSLLTLSSAKDGSKPVFTLFSADLTVLATKAGPGGEGIFRDYRA